MRRAARPIAAILITSRMTASRCIHGLDSRFCAACNRAARTGPRGATSAGAATAADILRFLNDTRTRATYGAVASVLGVPARSIGGVLGARRAEASWIVNADTGLPTDYDQTDWHPDLLSNPTVIRTGQELTLHLALWRAKGNNP
jgi:alkylated DNA nucleotide flippase Atl1